MRGRLDFNPCQERGLPSASTVEDRMSRSGIFNVDHNRDMAR